MKWLKQLGILLIFVFIVTAILSLVLPTSQTIERTVTIDAPANEVYQQLARLENFNRFAVWNQRDSLARHVITGTDGNTGAMDTWTGDPYLSGEGSMTITELVPDKKINHQLLFTKPKKGEATSTFTLEEINGKTTVTWTFRVATPRPKNIFNLFHSMDKEMGADFDEGLAALKKTVEGSSGKTTPIPVVEVKTLNFPATTYAIIRQQVKWDDIPAFYSQHMGILYSEITKLNSTPGIPAGFIFEWDEKQRLADVGAGLPVPAGTTIENAIIQIRDIPASKAVYADHFGAYTGVANTYPAIKKYLSENQLKQTGPIIEQYITDPGKVPDTARWQTRVIFLVE